MMDAIKNWAFSICCTGIICGIINILVPEGSVQKTFKTVLSTFFICSIISPVVTMDLGGTIDLSEFFSDKEITYEEIYFTDNSAEYIEAELYEATSSFLKKNDIKSKDILIKINISENGNIDINKFVITLENKCDIAYLSEKIKDEIGIKPEIIILEE